MNRALRAFAAAALAAFALGANAMQRTESVALGATPTAAWYDAAGSRVVAATSNGARAGGLTILERGGRIATLPLASAPVALAGAARRAVAGLADGRAVVVDLQAMTQRPMPLALDAIVRIVAADSPATAYVLGRNGRDTEIAAIDLETLAVRTTALADVLPVDVAYDAPRDRLVVLGAESQSGAAPTTFVQVLDGRSLAPAAAPARLGLVPRAVAMASEGEDIAVLDHVAAGARGELWRAVLWILDPQGVAKRSTPLGEARAAPMKASIEGEGVPGRIVVGDHGGGRVYLVVPATGAVGSTQLEAPLAAIGVVPASGAIVAAMPANGSAALLSATGERLDTVAIGHPGEAALDASYAVVPDADGAGALVVHGAEGTLTRLPKQPARLANLTDLWTDPAEPGWGVFVEQQGLTAFAALFGYGAKGEPSWLVMSNGARQPDGSYSGVLFRTQGPPPLRATDATPVGIMRIAPASDGSATLTYVADGQSVTRRIERFGASEGVKACRWTASPEPAPVARANFTALWSSPADPGWGVAVSHRGGAVFAVLFTYDEENRPAWMVMSRGRQVAPGQFAGELYRIGKSQVRGVGSMTLRFAAGDEGTVAWRIDGTEFRAPILKQRFAPLASRCG